MGESESGHHRRGLTAAVAGMAVHEVGAGPIQLGDPVAEVRGADVDDIRPSDVALGELGRRAYIDHDDRRVGGESGAVGHVDELNR